jgi:hypothetical protein
MIERGKIVGLTEAVAPLSLEPVIIICPCFTPSTVYSVGFCRSTSHRLRPPCEKHRIACATNAQCASGDGTGCRNTCSPRRRRAHLGVWLTLDSPLSSEFLLSRPSR